MWKAPLTMMLAIFLSLINLTYATIIVNNAGNTINTNLAPRDPTNGPCVTVCDTANYDPSSGSCTENLCKHGQFGDLTCMQIAPSSGLSSIKLHDEGMYCIIFGFNGCSTAGTEGMHWVIIRESVPDLKSVSRQPEGDWNDLARSIECFWNMEGPFPATARHRGDAHKGYGY
ncbi:hypothetical protein EJ08DRAFT_663678 [Tothia fuscella]|uniref:Uncharacterized protein n=1 Tax=Tothia fuscella TaxID=1048955 RepID=A0A9P4NKK3_9PEZI|nr:hypothetical protein EJ08DRAFT_663678 [Tothia fuscella]